MILISIDLELNQSNNNPKIIEIGAVLFEPDHGKTICTLHTYVNPGELIEPKITELTGISNATVARASDIKSAAMSIIQTKQKHQINPTAIVWGGAGSDSNDMSKIFKESGMENPFDRRIIDVKSVYQMLANSGNAGMRSKIGLFKALQNMGIGWDHAYGPPHRALADAYNTKRAYMFLSSCMNGGFSLHKKIKSLGEI